MRYRFQAMTSYSSKVADFNLPHLHLAPPLGSRSNFAETFGLRILETLWTVELFA